MADEELKAGLRITWAGLWVNLGLMALKVAGGILGNSQALIADAAHSASDLLTDVAVLVGLRMGRAPADERHHFGHGRMETLASALVGLGLLAAAIWLGAEAGWNIYHHASYQPTWLAFVVACLSVVIKEVLYRLTLATGRRIKSAALMANAWHHRSDSLSSLAVVVGVGLAALSPDWHIADAYAALAVSVLVAKAGVEVLWGAMKEFTDTAPSEQTLELIKSCARGVPGVQEVHDLKVRLSGGQYQMELHVVVSGDLTVREGHSIAKEVENCLKRDVEQLSQVIIHVDPA